MQPSYHPPDRVIRPLLSVGAFFLGLGLVALLFGWQTLPLLGPVSGAFVIGGCALGAGLFPSAAGALLVFGALFIGLGPGCLTVSGEFEVRALEPLGLVVGAVMLCTGLWLLARAKG